MNLIFRKTESSYFFRTEYLTREVFWNLYNSGCTDHLILHNLRKSADYVPELDLVAVDDGEIAGHIISSRANIIDEQNEEHEVLCAGPFFVVPSMQNKGIGSKLFEYSISESKKLGFAAIILFGNPDYYHRFGFRNAKEFGITTKDGRNFEPFMALELHEGALKNISGKFYDDIAFEVSEAELNEFEKLFPPKEKGKAKIDISEFEN